jgi:DNA-binding MltR family transcriptional regulator
MTTQDDTSAPGPDFDAVQRLYRELDKESDRGAVLVASAMIDDGLGDLILTHLVPNPTSSDSLFDGPNAPFQAFSAKIDAGYRLGIISDRFCRDLHLIRKIRNDVAHRAGQCDFNDSSIVDRVKALCASHGILVRSPKWAAKRGATNTRAQFIESASWMLFYIHARRMRVPNLSASRPEFGYSLCMDDEGDTQGG